jgi:hypothetical protein
MAHLGTISNIAAPPSVNLPSPLLPITDYDIQRGRPLGTLELFDIHAFEPVLVVPVSGYVVRQIRVEYRQLWPTHGQRFPQ